MPSHYLIAIKSLHASICVAALSAMCGCEGLRTISIENKSAADITVVAHPGIRRVRPPGQFEVYRDQADTVLIVPPHHVIVISDFFGPVGLFGRKLRPEELPFDKIKIVSMTDTTVAYGSLQISRLFRRRGSDNRIIVK